ncbi:hypothetical protein [Klebsiella variicola]|uniref:hypothetical protein n=1 Tax=Klebsiella variicola TaxID=244366 RepID=UPI001034365D|nr:hypothetical protein [Klebsiella variicola]
MKERGMIFNGEMVRAILDGRKTQTRRIIKDCTVGRDQISKFIQIEKKFIGCYPEDVPELIRECCPYGVPGDRIWVRETFCPVDDTQYGGEKWVDYRATPRYEASHPAGWDSAPNDAEALKWRPSIHMPRWASRILLEITGVRVERLRSMSQDDARAEGVIAASGPMEAGLAFRELWDSIYGEESWKANPWVWVIEFKRVEGGAV